MAHTRENNPAAPHRMVGPASHMPSVMSSALSCLALRWRPRGVIVLAAAGFLACAVPFGSVGAQGLFDEQPADIFADPAQAMYAEDALPQVDATVRSPGMNLPPSPSDSSGAGGYTNPFDPPAAPPVKTPEQIEAEIRTQAFNAAITGLLPMRPNEIRSLLERFDNTKQAVEVPIYPYPEPEVAVETISLDPGVKPPEIRVAVGHVTTLSILDVTGEPWPIQDVSWAGNFEVIEPEEGGNIIRITPLTDFTYGNVSIRLLTLKIPVTFILKTHRDSVHYRFDARIAQFGPMAKAPIMEGGVTLAAGSPAMSSILDGVPPAGAKRLSVSGVDSRTTAYKYESLTYVRTPLTLLSPGWQSSVSSADGMNVYTLANAPVLLLSDGGQMIRARLVEEEATP